ncbi:hypothetical protein B0H17DRAFT_576185 [Mycena rosella]|uniref:Cysteine protease n=1 Tax=Mycena rosella TaxID=1033263 RepID=A0AAD7BM06_MYCRO|nr:hypothetical protein B0H17DRAFT_576185 [Mycena rosella]
MSPVEWMVGHASSVFYAGTAPAADAEDEARRTKIVLASPLFALLVPARTSRFCLVSKFHGAHPVLDGTRAMLVSLLLFSIPSFPSPRSRLLTDSSSSPDTPSMPPFPPRTPAAHAEHARLLSWFLDAPAAPFGVHRMALAGRGQGRRRVVEPSAAAAAMRTLVDAFPACGLGVSVATDGTLYQTEVFAASHSPASLVALHAVHAHSSTAHSHSSSATPARSPGSSAGHSAHSKGHGKPETKVWGDRAVPLLLGIRLGLDGVNPVYHETIKLLYTFPQSVGIAGGRPSSSYYLVGVQENGLFYLDPHHSRPAVPS